ncbi:MAG: hypothetical protein K8R63_04185 [Bacteroidales bacterium]|nr:hypothetical protein [Bacteroidales bacterium]
MKLKYYLFILLLVAIASCKPEIDEFSPSKGGADFTSFIAVGNSLTAGYADGSLYESGQEASLPNILAKQFAFAGGGDFKQPMMLDDFGFGFDGATPVPKLVLGMKTDCTGETSMSPVRAPVDVNMANFQSVAAEGPYNNIAVPGVKTFHFFSDQLAGLFGNPYYARFAPDPTTKLIELTASIDATFFSLWIGSNDALGYALAGGAADALTDPADFDNYYNMILTSCIQNLPGAYDDAKGVIANIPDIMSIPYFSFMSTQIPYNGMMLDSAQAAGLNILYVMYGHPEITFQEGPNPFVVQNSDGSWGRMTADDRFLMSLPSDSMKCNGMGVAIPPPDAPAPFPIPHKYILDKAEIADIRDHIAQYNAKIFELSTLYNLAHVDMAKVLVDVGSGGITIDGIDFSATFVQGNTFSLDGIHLTPIGAAMTAHYFIEAINATYGAKIPQVNVTDYQAVQYP